MSINRTREPWMMMRSMRVRRMFVATALFGALAACSAGTRQPEAIVADRISPTTAPPTPAPTPGSTTNVATSPPATTTSITPTTTTTTTITTTDPPIRTITIAASGDVLPHSPLWRRAADNARFFGAAGYDFDPMLAGLAPLLNTVDLAICHLETPIAPIGTAYSTAPRYAVPEEIVNAIADAGYDRCSTASNHSADVGTAGIERTVEVLEANGLGQSGMARTPDEIAPRVFDVDGVVVSHLSYTFSYNGLSLPPDEPWRSALIDPQRIVADATAARALGAEVVIVSLHWGSERVHAPTAGQRDIAAHITANGAIDLVIGHHAHVVQPIEQVNGTWVVFGLGNILSNLPTSTNWPAASQDAIVVTVTIDVDGSGHATVSPPVAHPTWVDKQAGWQVRMLETDLADQTLSSARRSVLQASWDRTASIVGAFLESVGAAASTKPGITAP